MLTVHPEKSTSSSGISHIPQSHTLFPRLQFCSCNTVTNTIVSQSQGNRLQNKKKICITHPLSLIFTSFLLVWPFIVHFHTTLRQPILHHIWEALTHPCLQSHLHWHNYIVYSFKDLSYPFSVSTSSKDAFLLYFIGFGMLPLPWFSFHTQSILCTISYLEVSNLYTILIRTYWFSEPWFDLFYPSLVFHRYQGCYYDSSIVKSLNIMGEDSAKSRTDEKSRMEKLW